MFLKSHGPRECVRAFRAVDIERLVPPKINSTPKAASAARAATAAELEDGDDSDEDDADFADAEADAEIAARNTKVHAHAAYFRAFGSEICRVRSRLAL